MHITIMDIFIFFISYSIIYGIWQFIYIKIHKKGYELEKKDNESFYDFMCRYYEDNIFWKIRKKFGLKWIYNSKVFELFLRLKGVIFILFGFIILFFIFWLSKTEYYVWLSIEL